MYVLSLFGSTNIAFFLFPNNLNVLFESHWRELNDLWYVADLVLVMVWISLLFLQWVSNMLQGHLNMAIVNQREVNMLIRVMLFLKMSRFHHQLSVVLYFALLAQSLFFMSNLENKVTSLYCKYIKLYKV